MMMFRLAILPSLMILDACAHQVNDSDTGTLLVQQCAAAPATDRFFLGDVASEGDEVLVHVETSGGCARHTFSACWDGQVLDSLPPIVVISMSHDAHGDTCDALLAFDLRL